MERARAYEAEYLLTIKQDFKPNKYQQQVLDHYPRGLASLDADQRYELQEYGAKDFATLEAGKTVGGLNG